MSDKLLVAAGFLPLSVRGDASIYTNKVNMNVSVVQPADHANPQVVLKLNREILNQMNLEIAQRVKVLSNPDKKTLAVMKAGPNDSNSFAISSQGCTVSEAIERGRGGTVKIGWRDEMGDVDCELGTYSTEATLVGNTLIVPIP